MSEIGRELQLLLQAAYRESLTRRHAYLTVEHLLYALLHDERGCDILRHSGTPGSETRRRRANTVEPSRDQHRRRVWGT